MPYHNFTNNFLFFSPSQVLYVYYMSNFAHHLK